jgi:hypothetical protein
VKEKERGSAGLSVAEVVIAIAFLAITFVSLLSVLAGGLKHDRKAYLKNAATATARALLTKTLSEVSKDSPAGTKDGFWATDYPYRTSPYREGEENAADVTFHYEICTETVRAISGQPFGAPDHRLKQVDVYVRWGQEDERTGFGSTVYHDRRIVSEASGDPL